VLCFFRKLNSNVEYNLFLSYCTSYYGCELWSLTTSNISDFCTVWRRGVRAIWNFPYTTHSYLLPLISQCLPIFDELCRRLINFARSCVSHVDGIFHGSSNYIVHSYYNRSIADVQVRASSFLFELFSTRDSRQSYFGNVAVTKAELMDIINHICSS